MADRFKEDLGKVEETEKKIRVWLKERELALKNKESTGRVSVFLAHTILGGVFAQQQHQQFGDTRYEEPGEAGLPL